MTAYKTANECESDLQACCTDFGVCESDLYHCCRYTEGVFDTVESDWDDKVTN